jgi:hypothetical protein
VEEGRGDGDQQSVVKVVDAAMSSSALAYSGTGDGSDARKGCTSISIETLRGWQTDTTWGTCYNSWIVDDHCADYHAWHLDRVVLCIWSMRICWPIDGQASTAGVNETRLGEAGQIRIWAGIDGVARWCVIATYQQGDLRLDVMFATSTIRQLYIPAVTRLYLHHFLPKHHHAAHYATLSRHCPCPVARLCLRGANNRELIVGFPLVSLTCRTSAAWLQTSHGRELGPSTCTFPKCGVCGGESQSLPPSLRINPLSSRHSRNLRRCSNLLHPRNSSRRLGRPRRSKP